MIITFKEINDKLTFTFLLNRYFDFLKKEKNTEDFILIQDNTVILKKESFKNIKKPILKISNFYDSNLRNLQAKELICDKINFM